MSNPSLLLSNAAHVVIQSIFRGFFVFCDMGCSSIATKHSNQISFARHVQQCHDVRRSGKSVSHNHPYHISPSTKHAKIMPSSTAGCPLSTQHNKRLPWHACAEPFIGQKKFSTITMHTPSY